MNMLLTQDQKAMEQCERPNFIEARIALS